MCTGENKQKDINKDINKDSNIIGVIHEVHETVVNHCDICNAPLTPSDVNDYGSLCRKCYLKEYYD
jgi:hypothetical protein